MNTNKIKKSWFRFWHEEGLQLLAVTLGAAVILPLMSLLSIQTGRTLTQQLNLIGSQSKIISEKIKNIEAAATTLAPFEKDRPRVDLAIPDEQSPAQLLNKINLILGQQQLTLLSLRMDKATVLKAEVATVNVYLEFVGFYPNIAGGLRDFETDTQQFDMGSLRISRRRDDFQLEANLVLKTYYYRRDAADGH